MTTNLDIIKRAMKKIHVLGAGAEPTSVQAAAAMDNLQSLYVELIGMGSLGRLCDVLATADTTARSFQRIRADSGVTISPPTSIVTQADCYSYPYGWDGGCGGPDYGWWYSLYGCGKFPRTPFDMTPVVIIDDTGEETSYIYVSERGAWVVIDDLTQQNDFPFAGKYTNGFACMLAERLVDEYDGGEVGAETKNQANNCRLMLTSRFDGVQRPAAAEYF